MRRIVLFVGSVVLPGVALSGCGTPDAAPIELLNVSYDPTRELFRDLNRAFVEAYEAETGRSVRVKQSHGGSGSQARAVIDGLPADVVTLALWYDIEAIRKEGFIAAGWEDRLPARSLPYYSSIVFVVRKGNPKHVRDWPDLAQPGVAVMTPNPKTSGNGKLSFLAAWGALRRAGYSEAETEAAIRTIYRNMPVLDASARACTITFSLRNVGDVHLTWENEAHLEVRESRGTLEIVYPPASIKAEPHVALVDDNVDRRGTRGAAEAYLNFFYTPAGQRIIARHHFRPENAAILAQHRDTLPELVLFPMQDFVADWPTAHQRFFAEGGVFDRIYSPAASDVPRN